MAGVIHAWMLAFLLAAILVGAVTVPAGLVGFRVRAADAVEVFVALGLILLAALAAVL